MPDRCFRAAGGSITCRSALAAVTAVAATAIGVRCDYCVVAYCIGGSARKAIPIVCRGGALMSGDGRAAKLAMHEAHISASACTNERLYADIGCSSSFDSLRQPQHRAREPAPGTASGFGVRTSDCRSFG